MGLANRLAGIMADSDVYAVLRSLGIGVSVIHTLYTDKPNFDAAVNSFKELSRAAARAGGRSSRLLYIVEEQRILHAIRRQERILWSRRRSQARLVPERPREAEGLPLKAPQGYVVGDAYVVETPKLSSRLAREARRVRVLVEPDASLAVEDGRVKGIRVAGGLHPADYVIVDEDTALELGFEVPRNIPLTGIACLNLQGPQPPLTLAWPGGLLAPSSLGATLCSYVPRGLNGFKALEEALLALWRILESPLPHVVSGLRMMRAVVPPDHAPLVGAPEGWPEGLLAVMGCQTGCLQLSGKLAESLLDLIEGREPLYSIDRLAKRKLFAEYIGLISSV